MLPRALELEGCCECGNEPSGSVKGGEFLVWLSDCQLLKKDFAPRSCLVGYLLT